MASRAPGHFVLYRVEAWGHRADPDRGARTCRQRHPRERGLSGPDRYADRPRGGRLGREEIRGVVKIRARRRNRQGPGNRVGGALAVQPGSELCSWARPGSSTVGKREPT